MPYKDKELTKQYKKEYFLKNKAKYQERDRLRLVRAREYVKNFKQGKSCVDCGESRWQCLEFDHRNPNDKFKGISIMIKSRYSPEAIQKELDKCDIVCANCHRIRHNGCVWDGDSAKE